MNSGFHIGTGVFTPRKILVRNCYLNPNLFGKFRTDFVRAGFSVIDCPPLTSRNKNSADIYMVISMMDLLSHSTRFDEFIILSADADFTPVVLRLRAHDRRTTILANEVVASAYKAACDFVVEQHVFIEDAIGIGADEDDEQTPEITLIDADYKPVVAQIAHDLKHEVLDRGGELDPEFIPALCKKYPDFVGSNWFGLYSLKRLAQEVVTLQPEIAFAVDESSEWKLVYVGSPITSTPITSTVQHGSIINVSNVLSHVKKMLNEVERPLLLSYLGMQLVKEFGTDIRDADWCGTGTLSDLLEMDETGDLKLYHQGQGRDYVYNPRVHDISSLLGGDETTHASRWAAAPAGLQSLVERVSRVTGVPPLPPDVYILLFSFIAEAVEQGHHGMAALSKVVRDRLVKQGEKVSRNQVNYVLTGLKHAWFDVVAQADKGTPHMIENWFQHVTELCALRGLQLDENDEELMKAWLCKNDETSAT